MPYSLILPMVKYISGPILKSLLCSYYYYE